MSNQSEENALGGYEPEREATHSLYDENTGGGERATLEAMELAYRKATHEVVYDLVDIPYEYPIGEYAPYIWRKVLEAARGTATDVAPKSAVGGVQRAYEQEVRAMGFMTESLGRVPDNWPRENLRGEYLNSTVAFGWKVWQAALASQPKVTEEDISDIIELEHLRYNDKQQRDLEVTDLVEFQVIARAILARFPWIKGV